MTGHPWKAADWLAYIGMSITIFAAFLAAYASTSHGVGIVRACWLFGAAWGVTTWLLYIRYRPRRMP